MTGGGGEGVAQPVKLSASAVSVSAVRLRTFCGLGNGMVFVLVQLLVGLGGGLVHRGLGGQGGGARVGVCCGFVLPAGVKIRTGQRQADHAGGHDDAANAGDERDHANTAMAWL
jgi:hypothetical protein